jgi:hypothetical protein
MRSTEITEHEVRTILAVIESIKQHCHYRYSELNTFMGSLTIDEMNELYGSLKRWYHSDDEEDEEEW